MLPPDICRRVGARLLLRHFWYPWLTCTLLPDISVLSVVLPAQLSCLFSLCSFSGTSLLILNQSMPQLPGRIYQFLGKTSQNRKDHKKFSQAIQIYSHASNENQCLVRQNWQPTTPCVSHLYTLVHIIPLLKSSAVKIQPTKCTSIFLQSNLTKSSRDEDDTIFDLVILFSDKYPRNSLVHEHKEKYAKNINCVTVWKTEKPETTWMSNKRIDFKIVVHRHTLEYYATVKMD